MHTEMYKLDCSCGHTVEIPAGDPKAEPKKVTIKTGISDGLNIEIVSGLKKGEKVVERPPKEIS